MTDIDTYIKRLQTVQNMTDTTGVKELCEIIMEYLESLNKSDMGFKKGNDK